jgi:hypothetical protein
MKKNIIIILLVITSAVFGVLSLINRMEAGRLASLANERMKIALERRELVQRQVLIAEEATKEAERQKQIVEDLLEKCQQNK